MQPTQQQPGAATNFVDPTIGGGAAMKMRDLVGRAVVLVPLTYDPAAPGLRPGTTQERITMDVLVLDGGPVTYGDNRTTGTPATHRIETPCYVAGMVDSHVNIVRALRPHVGTGVAMPGRIQQGVTTTPGNNPPWNIVPLDPSDPARRLAADIMARRSLGQWTSPEPVELNAQPQHQTAQQPVAQYGQPQAAATPACPPGWDPAVWAAMPAEAKTQIAGPLGQPTGF